MGCYTIYVVREHDGSIWATGSKYGPTEFASAGELDAYLAGETQRWEPSDLGGSWCRGWFVDRGARVARTYRCDCAGASAFELDRSLRAMPGWNGWDIGVAWERSVEVAARAGIAAAEPAPELDAWIGFVEAGCITRYPTRDRFPHRWDPATNTLAFDYFDDYVSTTALTTIDARNRVHDYGFDDDVLLAALGRGTLLLDELKTIAPVPLMSRPPSGAVIDSALRTIWLWCVDDIAPATFAELCRRWPGWRVERELAGWQGARERTGRPDCEEAEDPPVLHHALPPRSFEYIVEQPGETILPERLSEQETRLLEAIHADLDSDDARLVYADYLLARGDQRGKFIAVQCEAARLARRGDRSAHRRELEDLSRTLARAYGREEVSGGSKSYGRGFIDDVNVENVEALVDHLVFEQVPTLQYLTVRTLATDAVATLAEIPRLAHLRGFIAGAEPGALRALARVEPLAGLRRLEIRSRDPAVARELAAVLVGPHPFGNVEELCLSGHGFDNGGVVAVLATPRLERLARLVLHDTSNFNESGARELARCSSLARLERIELRGTVGHDQAVLARSPHLARLRSFSTVCTGREVELLEGLPGLRELELLYRATPEANVARLATSKHLARLEVLALDQISPHAVSLLADSPYLDGIVELRLTRLWGDSEPAIARLRVRLGDRLATSRL